MFGGYEHPVLSLAKRLVTPLVIFFSLNIAIVIEHQKFDGLHFLLGIFAFLIASHVFDSFEFFEGANSRGEGIAAHGRDLLIAWAIVLGILTAVGSFSGIIDNYKPRVLLLWSLLTPLLLFIGHSMVRAYLEAREA